jgi:hypothetical protein
VNLLNSMHYLRVYCWENSNWDHRNQGYLRNTIGLCIHRVPFPSAMDW